MSAFDVKQGSLFQVDLTTMRDDEAVGSVRVYVVAQDMVDAIIGAVAKDIKEVEVTAKSEGATFVPSAIHRISGACFVLERKVQ